MGSCYSKRVNVSRTPVREEIRRLAGDGLVKIIPNWGAHSVSPTKEEVIDTCRTRWVLEELAIHKAVKHVTPVSYIYIYIGYRMEEELALENKAAEAHDVDSYIKTNSNFHLIIAEAAGSKSLFEVIDFLLAKVVTHLLFYEDSLFNFAINPTLGQHQKIINALKAKDEELCAKLIRADIYPWVTDEEEGK